MRRIILIMLLLSATAYGQSTSGWQIVSTPDGGTNLYVNGARVASIAVDQITVSTNWGWEDLRFPVGVASPKNASADIAENIDNNSITFETGASTNRLTDDHVWGVAQMPHTWRKGSEITPHVHFEQTNADQTNCWYMYYRVQPIYGQMTSAWTFTGPASNMTAYTSNIVHQLAIFANIDMTGAEESSIVDWKLYRLGSAGTGDIEFKEFDIHYQIEKPTGERFVP